MTRLEALKALAEGVETGAFEGEPGGARAPCFNRFMSLAEVAFPQDVRACNVLAWDAYSKKSIDAAKALHEALLPDFGWRVGMGNVCVYKMAGSKSYEQSTGFHNPARAWLLAILRALIAQEVDA